MDENKKSEFLKVFGNYVRFLRQSKGWTQEELATKCGYTSETRKSTINKIESGKSDIPASKIRALAKVLGVAPSELIDPPQEARKEIAICDIFSTCHGEDAYRVVQKFLKLDESDRGVTETMVDSLLGAPKYKEEPASSAAMGA